MAELRDQTEDGAAVSPKDPVTGQLKTQPGPLERPGTEAAEEAREGRGDQDRDDRAGKDRSGEPG